MKLKLNLIGAAITVTLLSGCQTTPVQITDNKVFPKEVNKNTPPIETIKISSSASSNHKKNSKFNDFGSQELRKTINDDYYKEKMLIEMECQSKLSEASESTPNTAPTLFRNNGTKLKDEADRVISELESRLSDGSDKELQFAYEVEIARLKLEFQISSLEQTLTEFEVLKEFELDKANLLSSIEYECAVRHSENRQNKTRMLDLIERGIQISDKFNEKIMSIEDSLDESRMELESLNTETFDGIMY